MSIETAKTIEEALTLTKKKVPSTLKESTLAPDATGTNIVMGVGILSNGEITNGLNPSFLGMALVARQVQAQLMEAGKRSRIHILVADKHAAVALDADQSQFNRIEEITGFNMQTLYLLFNALCSPDFEVTKTSSFVDYQGTYEHMQTETIEGEVEKNGAGVKIGWKTYRQPQKGQPIRDEVYFDTIARQDSALLDSSMSSGYAPEGISLTNPIVPGKPLMANLPPYYCDNTATSLGNLKDFPAALKSLENSFGQSSSKQVKNFFAPIGRDLRTVLGVSNMGNIELVQAMIEASILR